MLTMLQELSILLASVSVTFGVRVSPEKLLQLTKETGISIRDIIIKPCAVSLMPDKSFSLTVEGMLRLQVGDWLKTWKENEVKLTCPFKFALD